MNVSDGTNATYYYNGSTTNSTDIITVNQTLNTTLSDGYYTLSLDCSYYISTNIDTANQTINRTINTTINQTINQTINVSTQKTILIDTIPPIIISNQTNTTLYNGTALLNFTIMDLSTMNCLIALGNTTITIVSNTSNVSIPLNISIISQGMSQGNYSNNYYNISYNISCADVLNNTNAISSSIIILSNSSNTTVQDIPFFSIDVSKPAFNLGEIGYYTINANNNSNVSITVCPIANGWVQCYMTPTFVNDTFPKTQALPYTNKTGRYIISGVMHYKNYTITGNVTYETANTLTASITPSESMGVVGDIVTFNASAALGVGTYTYRWTMHDGTIFNGNGAYKNFTAAGTFRENLTVNDSAGNNFTTSIDVTIKNRFTLTVVVIDKKDNTRISDADVTINSNTNQTSSDGTTTFSLIEGSYDIYVSKDNYGGYVDQVLLDSDKTFYMNMTFIDITPPNITLLTDNDSLFTKDTVDIKFKAHDVSVLTCSLYIANINDSWYVLKDSGDNLAADTTYTFEIRDLNGTAYKWKIECMDKDQNKAYSEERTFIISDGSVTTALQSTTQNSDDINTALDNMDKLSGDESTVSEILNIKSNLKDLLNKINSEERDIHDLVYRRDLDDNGREEAQKNITDTIDQMKYTTPINLKVTDSKTFVKYVHDDDLKSVLDEYLTIKNLKLDKKSFLEFTKRAQSKVIISTHVLNVELYYIDGRVNEITLVTKDIQVAKAEDEAPLKSSTSITFVEVIPKTIAQTAKNINMVNTKYTILKDDPLIEYSPDTTSILYYINGTIKPDDFENTDTILIEKNINTVKSMTGFSILGINSISDVQIGGQGVMIIIIFLLILFYLIVNFDIIDKIRNMNIGFMGIGSKKKVSFIKVLINDALDYLKTEDYDKAALIYREIKLSYEEANNYVKKQVYDESFDLCNQLDLNYALQVLDKAEYYIRIQDKNNAIIEFEKLENTYNKLSETYQAKIDDRFRKITEIIKNTL